VSALNIEKHIGQYKILRTLGAGGMGTVYLGEHLLLGRRAAIKTLLPLLSSHREIVDRFFNEARAISAISDPGVVQIFDFGYHVDGTAYIVMEFLEGESLSARLDRLGKLPLLDALRLARQLSSSLAAAHDRGIIHRDLKPGNVFVIRDPEVPGGERAKILDFGICKLGDPDYNTTATQTGTMLGTPVYMSPEQCRGAGRIDHRSDIYSLGCVLFHMVAGQPPFDCETVGDYIAAHIRETSPAPSTLAPELPPAVDALMRLCLAKDPEQRFHSMSELQQALEQVLVHISDHGAASAPMPKYLQSGPLGDGFKSSYDVNLGNKLRTVDQTPTPPQHSWFVDSQVPVEISDHYLAAKPGLGWGKRAVLALALLVGLAGGLGVTNRALEAQAATPTEPPSSLSIGSAEDVGLAYTDIAHEIAPPEPIAEAPVELDENYGYDPDYADEDTPPPPKRSVQAARRQPPAPRIQKPVQPRPVVRKQSKQSDVEDLYDMR
jgi:serine/threonine protein kinase